MQNLTNQALHINYTIIYLKLITSLRDKTNAHNINASYLKNKNKNRRERTQDKTLALCLN